MTRVEPTGDDEFIVYTRHSARDVAIRKIDFRLRPDGERYRIVDVWLDGFSVVSLYRNEYTEILIDGGIEGLIETLRAHPSTRLDLAFNPTR